MPAIAEAVSEEDIALELCEKFGQIKLVIVTKGKINQEFGKISIKNLGRYAID